MTPEEKKIRDDRIYDKLHESLIEDVELEAIDMEQRVADCIDECYSFEKVGGMFVHILPSEVLKHMDPVAFRCMVADEGDSDDLVEFEDRYYDKDAFEELKDTIESEVDAELEAEQETK